MEIDLSENYEGIYPLLVGMIAPRPIAWVTSKSEAGIVNLAPFSFFNLMGVNPPVVVFSPLLRADGSKKDTLLNIEATREFVIHAATEEQVENINLSSKTLPHQQSELDWLKIETLPSKLIGVPRIASAAWAIECRLQQVVPLGGLPLSGNLVIGQIVYLHIRDKVLGSSGQPDPRQLKSVARLGGEYWCRSQELFTEKRP